MLRGDWKTVLRALAGASLLWSGAALAEDSRHWDVLQQYCFECHNTEDWAGGVALDTLTPEGIPGEARTWEAVIRKLRGRLMPPGGRPQPETRQVKALVDWLEQRIDTAAAGHAESGRVGLHRLNRKEYANAVRDLLGLAIQPEALLPRDDGHDGFDNIASALQVTPSFLDQYLSAGQTVATRALGNLQALPAGTTYTAAGTGAGTQQRHRDGLPFGTRGGFVVEHDFPADGEYALNIGNMAGALWVVNMEHRNTLVALLDGQEFFRTTIGGPEDLKAIDQKQDPAVDAINRRLKDIRFKARAGLRKVAVTFVARSFAESDSRLHTVWPGGGQEDIQRVGSFEVRGPFTVTGLSLSPSRARVLAGCEADIGSAPAPRQRACAADVVERLARQAFRRPLVDADRASLLRLYDGGHASGGFELGLRRLVTGILSSPHFLFRSDATRAVATDGSPVPLTDLALASRLSFFLWSSLPDEALLREAEAGRLGEPAVLRAQVRRMLQDPRASALAGNFAAQWLNVGKLDEIDADGRLFPHAAGAADIRPAMREELRLFVDSILREDRSVRDLLTADHSFLNERLALHYGIRDVRGDRFRRVTLADPNRHGLLGKGAVLMLTSYPNRTAPVLRGAWLLERIIGTPPAPPPPQVESLKETPAGEKPRTIRAMMELHRAKPSCQGCHGVMDPLGFALENFDAVGQYRVLDRDARSAIDASGVLPDGRAVRGPVDLREAILADGDQFPQTFTEKLLAYATGRAVEPADMPLVRRIVREAAREDYRFSAIVAGIVGSDAFARTQDDPATPPLRQASR